MLYDIGDRVRLSATFVDSAGDLKDPTAVTLTIYEPGDSAGTAVTPTSPTTGVWEYAYTPEVKGVHMARFVGTGDVVATQWVGFTVRDSESEARGTAYAYGASSWESIV